MKVRNNPTEEAVREMILNVLKPNRVFEGIQPYGVYKVQRSYDGTKLFTDVPSSYFGYRGGRKFTEMAIHCKTKKIDVRIDCKHLYEPTSAFVIKDLIHVSNNPEKSFIFVLEGEGYKYPLVLLEITDTIKRLKLKNRVQIMSLEEFEKYLYKIAA
jgi:hypothetical protein